MKYRRTLTALLTLLMLPNIRGSARSADYATGEFFLVGAVFDDGGQATGSFGFTSMNSRMPLPQFYNIQISTSTGSTLSGSRFSSMNVCYNNRKKFVCAPNDNLLISLEVGTPGEPGYDHFQFAAYFAPQALVGTIGSLDPVMSYETGCTLSGCFTRHIIAGALRL